ncbi:MAG: hypothetical protein M3N13_08060, partial [Candidatus Eremiobacteraeota bacterium]|nr:hypothetical protein [Candidatus Eremiobacteraeota bacterium]
MISKRVRITALVVLSFCTFSGCSGSDSSTSPPADPIVGTTFKGDTITYVQNSNCAQAAQPTGFEFFKFTTQSGATLDNQHSYWTVKHPTGGYQLNVNTSSLSGTMKRANSEAISAWTAALLAHRRSSSAYTITLVEDSNAGDPVTAYQVAGVNPNDEGAKGDTVYYAVSAGGMQQKTNIDFYMDNLASVLPMYNIALHELGHAMVLAHNGSANSVMVPETSEVFCFQENSQPPAADYQPLEDYYDPTLSAAAAGNGGDGTKCFGSRCYQSIRVQRDTTPLPQIKTGAFGWYHVHNYGSARQLSPDSLYLSSSLVAQGTLLRDVASINAGFDQVVVRAVHVNQVYRHDSASGASGPVAYVMDIVHRDGESYRDDFALTQRNTPIMFLRPADPYWKSKFHVPNLYQFTAPFVSKWEVSSSSRKLHVASYLQSEMGRQINGTSADGLFRKAAQTYGQRAVLSETSFVAALLRQRGIVSVQDVAKYDADLHRDPRSVLRMNVRYDLAR